MGRDVHIRSASAPGLEEDVGVTFTSSVLKGMGEADMKSAKRFLVLTKFCTWLPLLDKFRGLSVKSTGRERLCHRRTTNNRAYSVILMLKSNLSPLGDLMLRGVPVDRL